MSYSIPQQLRDEIQRELAEDEDQTDVLQDKLKKVPSDNVDESKRKRAKIDVGYEPPSLDRRGKEELDSKLVTEVPGVGNLLFFSEPDRIHFGLLLDGRDDTELDAEEKKKRGFLRLVLRVKNCAPVVRKQAMRMLNEKAGSFGSSIIFDNIVPILVDRALDDQERHLMIKIMDRMILRLGEDVIPFAKKLLDAIGPLLLDKEPMIKATGTEIIVNITSVIGFGGMIKATRSNIEDEDEYLRNCSAHILAVVTKTVGLNQMIPFFTALSKTRKTWRIRHTGIKIIQQTTLLLGSAVLPFLEPLLSCLKKGIKDEQISIKILTASAIALLAQYSYPHGMSAFEVVLEDIWKGLKTSRGKLLSSYLKVMASIIPLMDAEYAGFYSTETMRILKREFNSPDDEMRKTVLLVLQKCSISESVTPSMLRDEIAEPFFSRFWVRRVALDLPMNKLVVFTTTIISEKIGGAFSLKNLINPLKDESEPLRIMATHALDKIIKAQGTTDIDNNLEALLVDNLLISFQEQSTTDPIIYRGLGTLAKGLNTRMKPYLAPIISTALNLLKHKTPQNRQNAADLCAIIAPVIWNCKEYEMLNKINIILYESLGEVYPEVLGSIVGAIYEIVKIVDIEQVQPPINQILPTLTPILGNVHKKVQINTIRLISTISLRGPSFAPPKEWMRICFRLLDLLKSPTKTIRRDANDTFGYIAKAIGPQDILVALLDNLKAQERQLRVSTSVAIAIVAKTCGPYTVIPALMNEYKTPETNVQNGILKAMAFMFEDIGGLASDYIYFLVPLIEDALTDRDLVHRQTAATIIRHLALHSSGRGFEDAFIHLLNLLIPNIFETSPHVIERILEGLDALAFTIGPSIFLNYIWAGLFHQAQKVRNSYWIVYNRIYKRTRDAIVPAYPTAIREQLDLSEMDTIL
ncbi:hypothetical protein RNJ44_00604 [Nakaseomyces bracarensis]|uniref:Phosphatase PP2A regulatory subunit A/Splicing factor 3B subunit 1-like HEAT repeat domain-containing protein n=1 Tax=Nakaseomyces bracarensis TaxID=273131 RepID=A0ABR4NRL2_9SACH